MTVVQCADLEMVAYHTAISEMVLEEVRYGPSMIKLLCDFSTDHQSWYYGEDKFLIPFMPFSSLHQSNPHSNYEKICLAGHASHDRPLNFNATQMPPLNVQGTTLFFLLFPCGYGYTTATS